MTRYVDFLLNRITMYKLTLYYLSTLFGAALILSFLGVISYTPWAIIFSTAALFAVCFAANKIFSFILKASVNIESVYITALILALIITPAASLPSFILLIFAGVVGIASKFIFAIGKKHIFNPAAAAVVITPFFLGRGASWWIGSAWFAPFVIIGGIFVTRKIKRFDLALTFFAVAGLTIAWFDMTRGIDIFTSIGKTAFNSPLLFVGFVMLTEPRTTPPTRKLRVIYAAIVGFLFAPQIHIGDFYTTPESALVIGNVFSYFVSPKENLVLYLEKKIHFGPNMAEFIFKPAKKFRFRPGQYMEWTLPHSHIDFRGNRRYFTIASSPTEENIHLGVRLSSNGSSFKKAMANLSFKTPIVASQLAGDFVLPKDSLQKLTFVAGGIGITPFRSMIKYLIDTKNKRDIILLYSNKEVGDIMYKDIFDEAEKSLDIKTIYTLTDTASVPNNWKGLTGRINEKVIQKEVPDFMERIFYLSGPHSAVSAYESVLKNIGVLPSRVKSDYFPGFV